MDNIELSQKIKMKCKEKNITVNQLALDCGLSKGFIYELEKRNKSLSSDRIFRIAKYLNCSSDFLLGLENSYNTEKENRLLELFNKLDENYQKQVISQVLKLVIEMSNKQDECINKNKAYIAALGGGVTEINKDLAKYIKENAVVDEYDPNN